MSNAASYAPSTDPSEWGLANSSVVIAVDVGYSKDHSAIAVMSCHHNNIAQMIGIRAIHQLPLLTPDAEVAAMATSIASSYRDPRIVVDISNQRSFLNVLGQKFGSREAARTIIGVTITNATTHAPTPQWTRITLFGQQTDVPTYRLCRNQLLEDLAAEMDNGTLRCTETTDAPILQHELASITIEDRASGRSVYTSSTHDDCAIATSMGLWCLRGVGAPRRHRRVARGPSFSKDAWT